MRYSLSLLKKYIGVQDTAENIARKLTLKTCEIEEIIERNLPKEIVIGKVLEVKQHENADKLKVCQIDCGKAGKYQICTGGENIIANVFVPVAIPGCYLPAIDLKIEPRKMRWEESNGMICSKGEIGIMEDEDKHWIWIMNEDLSDLSDADIGTPLGEKYPWMNNAILDVDNKTVTHRPDLTGHFGIAWEIQALYAMEDGKHTFNKLPDRKHNFETTNMLDTLSNANKATMEVDVQTDACQSYVAVQLNDVSVQRSSLYTRLAMQDIGQQSRNNWVDFSNLFMMSTGQPIHMFDADEIKGNLIVRNAKKWEMFIDLFDKEHSLIESDIVIADKEKVLALAGVVGGKSSGVTDETKNIIVEIAHFDPVAVRKTGTRLGLRTDAELRYEKHINPLFSLYAFIFFLEEIKYFATDLGQYTLTGISYHVGDTLQSSMSNKKKITIDAARWSDIIFGENRTDFNEIATKVLTNLWFEYKDNTATIPLWRSPDDMNIPEDIYEEIARVFGYDNIPAKAMTGATPYVAFTPEVVVQRVVEDYLIHDAQMNQCETYPWSDEKTYDYFMKWEGEYYTVMNPAAPELSKLRPDMIYSLMDIVEKNHRTFDEIRCFDTGKIWPIANGQPKEVKVVGMVSYKKTINNWQEDTILDVKAHTMGMLNKLGITNVQIVPMREEFFHPKKQARLMVGDMPIGYMATVHPLVLQNYKIGETSQVSVAILDIDKLQTLMNMTPDSSKWYETLQDQIVYRDVCFVIDKDKPWSIVFDPISKLDNIANINVFDLYAWNKLPEWKKSVAFTFSIKGDGTMTSEQINEITQHVIKTAESNGATLR